MVSDLPFAKIVELIEGQFGLRLSDIEGWEDIQCLRDTVNAFKHRGGFKHPREINWSDKDCIFPQCHEIGQEEGGEAISSVARFFRAL